MPNIFFFNTHTSSTFRAVNLRVFIFHTNNFMRIFYSKISYNNIFIIIFKINELFDKINNGKSHLSYKVIIIGQWLTFILYREEKWEAVNILLPITFFIRFSQSKTPGKLCESHPESFTRKVLCFFPAPGNYLDTLKKWYNVISFSCEKSFAMLQ